jgi:RNA recognition motif-containing protein
MRKILKAYSYKVYIGNLDPRVDESMLFKPFSERYRTALYAKVFKEDIKNKLRCYGFVYFSEGSEITKAIMEMNETVVLGRKIKTGPGLKQPSKTKEKASSQFARPIAQIDMATLEEFAHMPLEPLPSEPQTLKGIKTKTSSHDQPYLFHDKSEVLPNKSASEKETGSEIIDRRERINKLNPFAHPKAQGSDAPGRPDLLEVN